MGAAAAAPAQHGLPSDFDAGDQADVADVPEGFFRGFAGFDDA